MKDKEFNLFNLIHSRTSYQSRRLTTSVALLKLKCRRKAVNATNFWRKRGVTELRLILKMVMPVKSLI